MPLKLNLNRVSKSYGAREVLSDCTLEFERGVYALMGPNGSGKSTILRLCALLEPPTRGSVSYHDGEALESVSIKRKITLVLPRAGIFNTTVFKNVAYGLKVRGMDKGEIRDRVNEVLMTVGLLHKAKHNALTVSSGEAQRLALARAMVLEPEVLFLDEPTASVDEQNTAIIEDLVMDMKKRGSPTVIMATHDKEQAKRLADRIIRMKVGKIVS